MKKINQFENYLLDLDGTLVEAPQRKFLFYNTWALYKRFVRQFGLVATIPIVKKSIESALENNLKTGMTNYELIVDTCHQLSNVPKKIIIRQLNEYYHKDFLKWATLFHPVPGAHDFIKQLKAAGKKVYIWTNPIWPEFNVLKRLEWAGYDSSDFSGITHSENLVACKPNVEYFSASLNLFKLDPKMCLYIGDSEYKDGPARTLGIETIILTPPKDKFWNDLIQNFS